MHQVTIIFEQDTDFIVTVFADALAPGGARSSAGMAFTTKYVSIPGYLAITSYNSYGLDVISQYKILLNFIALSRWSAKVPKDLVISLWISWENRLNV